MPNKKDELENRFISNKRIMDDLCRDYYGMTWDEHERLHGRPGRLRRLSPLFTACLQMAAELAGKEFDPANYTELELWQLCELYAASRAVRTGFCGAVSVKRRNQNAKIENDRPAAQRKGADAGHTKKQNLRMT